jgi:hypothetical protein
VQAGDTATIGASCDIAEVLVSGGFFAATENTNDLRNLLLIRSFPVGGNTWQVAMIADAQVQNFSLTVFALCAG